MSTTTLNRIVLAVIVPVCVMAGLLTFRMPEVTPVAESFSEFSAERAMAHVEATCRYPHPIGSAQISKVREYIATSIREMGIRVRLQTATVPDYYGITSANTVNIANIFAVLPGKDSSGAIALVGHYDTVPTSPGANDDGSAVATLLETMRSLLAGPPLRNDVIFLFTGAEEPGQYRYGAKLFVQNYDVSDVRLVLNFEALGHTGPSVMFETGKNNAWLINGLDRAASDPVAFSFMSDLYRNVAAGGTDFAAFDEIGVRGLDFAYAFERTVYHTALDNVESVDKRSLQQHGDYALNLTRYFGNANLQLMSATEGDLVFHSLPVGGLIKYPVSWSLALAIASGILLWGLAGIGIVRGKLSISGTAVSIGVSFVEMMVLFIVLTLAWWGIDQLHMALGIVVNPAVKAQLLLIGFAVLCFAGMIAARIWLSRKVSLANLAFGAATFWWLISLISAVYLPGFSVVLTWPVVFALLPLGWMVLQRSNGQYSRLRFGSLLGSTAVILVLITVPVYLFFHAMGATSPGFSGSPSFPIIGLSMLFWIMPLQLLLPHVELASHVQSKTAICVLSAVAGICIVAAGLLPGIPIGSFGL